MKRIANVLATSLLFSGFLMVSSNLVRADNHLGSSSDSMTPEPDSAGEVSQPSSSTNSLTEDYEEQPQAAEEFFVDALSLSEEQQSEIRAIFADYQPQIQQSYQEYLVSLDNLNSALTPATDSRVLIRARDEAVSLERQTYDLLFERNIAIRDVLNPGQRAVINVVLRDLFDIQPLAEVAPLPFPTNLIGQDAAEVVDALVNDGWFVVARTPRLVQLDKGDMSLDLTLDSSGQVDEASLR